MDINWIVILTVIVIVLLPFVPYNIWFKGIVWKVTSFMQKLRQN